MAQVEVTHADKLIVAQAIDYLAKAVLPTLTDGGRLMLTVEIGRMLRKKAQDTRLDQERATD